MNNMTDERITRGAAKRMGIDIESFPLKVSKTTSGPSKIKSVSKRVSKKSVTTSSGLKSKVESDPKTCNGSGLKPAGGSACAKKAAFEMGLSGAHGFSVEVNESDEEILVTSQKQNYQGSSTKIKMDKEGHLDYKNHDVIAGKYEILDTLGEGSFGKVVKVKELNKRITIALKISKNVEKYRETAELEINVLKELKKLDPKRQFSCVRMLDHFNYHGHMCIAFEMLGASVYDFLKDNDFCPFPMEHIRAISSQLCHSVNFLHSHKLTHTDLKPENILFVDSTFEGMFDDHRGKYVRRLKNPEIRLIDFGSAVFDREYHDAIVTTRHYRAPEVVLQLGWAQPCDVWSIGCILFELYSGEVLFPNCEDRDHLAVMKKVLGPIPPSFTNRSRVMKRINREETDPELPVEDYKPLEEYMQSDDEEVKILLDLIQRMLMYKPAGRITLKEALKHTFFDKKTPTQKTEP